MCNQCLKSAIFGLLLKTSKHHSMKRILPLLLLLSMVYFAGAQTSTPAAPASDPLVLKETAHDFGQIAQGKPVYYTFTVTNTGTTPLVLYNVQASCGCTTPEWKHEPIAPGATAPIKVGYNAAAEGPFDKHITITYNGTQTKQLEIKGTVWKAPEGAAPANASVQFLKKQAQ
jgi:hypothetical protein